MRLLEMLKRLIISKKKAKSPNITILKKVKNPLRVLLILVPQQRINYCRTRDFCISNDTEVIQKL